MRCPLDDVCSYGKAGVHCDPHERTEECAKNGRYKCCPPCVEVKDSHEDSAEGAQ
jgi:hypothetical protein